MQTELEQGDLVHIPIMKMNAIVVGKDDDNVILYAVYNQGATMSGPFNESFIELLSKDTKTKKKLNGRSFTKSILNSCTLQIEQDCNDTQ